MWKHGNVEIRRVTHWPFKPSMTEGENSKEGEDRLILQFMHINKETIHGNTYSVVQTTRWRFEEACIQGRVVTAEMQIAQWEEPHK